MKLAIHGAKASASDTAMHESRISADPDVLAYAVVRITEGFIYNDAIAAVEPAVEEAGAVVALLLTG